MSEYGIPYMGSKATMAKDLIKIFPKADNFYDLFGGGFSVTHAMLKHRSKGFKHFHFNEIRKGIPDLIKDAVNGKYSYKNFKPEFIDRDTFFKEKEKNPYIKLCWSFGNNGETYLFGKTIEPYKKSMHNAIVFNRFDNLATEVLRLNKFNEKMGIKARRLYLRQKIEYYRKTGIPKILHKFLSERQLRQFQQLQQIERLQQLQQLIQLERLQQLEQLQLTKLNFNSGSYEDVPILNNSIVYCDIPYKGTGEYDKNKSFNRKNFLDWAHGLQQPVYISEYDIEDKRFTCIWNIQKRSLFNSKKDYLVKKEKVYINEYGYNKYYRKK